MAGFDAIAHAVETAVTTRRTPLSDTFRTRPGDCCATRSSACCCTRPTSRRGAPMQLGAHFAGTAIEQSMLGAAHACANPLTARYDITHGLALAMLLPHVVRWNAVVGDATATRRCSAPPAPRRATRTPREALRADSRTCRAGRLGKRPERWRRAGGGPAGPRGPGRAAVDRHVQPAAVRCRWRAGDLQGGLLSAKC